MKEFGVQIARMLFEQRRPVDEIVKTVSNQVWINEEGKLTSLNVDPDWLKEQVEAVRDNPELWGYSMNILQPREPKLSYRSTPRKDNPPRSGD